MWSSGAPGPASVYAQAFDPGGQKAGSAITVFTGGSDHSWIPGGVSALPDGSFLVNASAEANLFVQKVSAAGQLVASGGPGDFTVNEAKANLLIDGNPADTLAYIGGPFYVGANVGAIGGYMLAPVRVSSTTPASTSRQLLNVDTRGLVERTVNISDGYVSAPVITRLSSGNYLVAGTSNITYAPVVWRMLTTGATPLVEQSLGAAPGNATNDPQVTALADGTALLTWHSVISTGESWVGARIDASGTVVGTASTSNHSGRVTGLAAGGYVQTWVIGSQLFAQYFDASGNAVGDPFTIADNFVASATPLLPSYSIAPTADGFIAVYQASTDSGQQIFERRFTGP